MCDRSGLNPRTVSQPLGAGNKGSSLKRSLMNKSKGLLTTIHFLQHFPDVLVAGSLFSVRFLLRCHLHRKAFLVPYLKWIHPALSTSFSLICFFSLTIIATSFSLSCLFSLFLACLSPLEYKAGYFLFCVLLSSEPKAAPGA